MGQLVSFWDFKQRLGGGCIYQAAVYYELDNISFTKTMELLSKHEGAGTLLICGIHEVHALRDTVLRDPSRAHPYLEQFVEINRLCLDLQQNRTAEAPEEVHVPRRAMYFSTNHTTHPFPWPLS